MKDYSELVQRYNSLVRRYNSRIHLLREYAEKNAALEEVISRLKREREEIKEQTKVLERDLINILVQLCRGRSNPRDLLKLLDSMALTDRNGTICMTAIGFSEDAIRYARDHGVTIVERPKGSLEEGLVDSYQSL